MSSQLESKPSDISQNTFEEKDAKINGSLPSDKSIEIVPAPVNSPSKDGPTEASTAVNEHSDKQVEELKLAAPDPDFAETDEDVEPLVAVESSDNQSIMEGAWADILGSGQLKKKTLRKGRANKRAQSGDICQIKFSGKLADGSIVDSQDSFEFILGDSEVIHAFDLIVALMELGEKCQVETAPRFAYGEIGLPPTIPPNATILYEIELLEFRPETPPESLSSGERLKVGNCKRERGNWWYARNEFSKAIICYRRALDFLDVENESEDDSPARLQNILEDRLKVYNNMAAAQLKVEAYDAAIKSLDVVLKCQPSNVKALYRKGKVLEAQGKLSDAIDMYKKALSIEPNEKAIKNDLAKLEAKKKNDRLKETSLYKKMMGTPVNDKKSDKNAGYEKVKLTVPWTLLIGSAIAFATSYVAYKYRFA